MLNNKNIFYKKKILIYGLGKSGLSTYQFLKKDARAEILFGTREKHLI